MAGVTTLGRVSETSKARVDVDSQDVIDALLRITQDLDLRGSLDRLVATCCDLTGARYGVLGLLDESGTLADFVIHGLDDEQMALVGALPTSHGILGLLVDDPRPLRLGDLGEHAQALGFPAHHPPMKTFLGVPVRVGADVLGNLYLTEKADGADFTERDEALVVILAQLAGFVIGTARTQLLGEQRREWLAASLALSHALEDSDDVPGALRRVASGLCEVAGALLVAVIGTEGEEVLIEHCSPGGRRVRISESSLAAARQQSDALVVEAVATGELRVGQAVGRTVVVVPLPSRLVPGRSLIVLLDDSGGGVTDAWTALLRAYADQAALALDRTQGLFERQEHMLVADRDRIARDLHDSVIQRIFAAALQLQGLRRQVLVDEVKVRLEEIVVELNTTIRDIRSTIFELQRVDGSSLKSEIRALAKEYVPVLGFTPFVRLRGEVESEVPGPVAEHLVATLREALSNVARHADADACVVEVDVADGRLTLRVSDNGRGIPDARSESGLRNVRRRATDLGGRFAITSEEPHGTLLEWQVPLA